MAEAPTQLDQRIVTLVEEAQSVDVRSHETGTGAEAMTELVPRVSALVDQALEAAQEILDRYEPEPEEDPLDALDAAFGPFDEDSQSHPKATDTGDFYHGIDALVGGQGPERVSDIAFIAIAELRQKREALERLHPELDGWEIVSECGSALRRLAKSFTALEVVLCEVEGLRPRLAYASELSRSLQVRRQYRLLRRAIQGEEPTEETIRTRLRSIGTRIAMLVGHGIYTDLRVHDRIQIRNLQRRILDWLREEEGQASWLSGRRLWQDLDGFAGLLQQVSRRQELVEHDAALFAELAKIDDEEALAHAITEHGRAVEGLDDELDAQLDARTMDAGALRQIVARVHRKLSPGAPGGAGAMGRAGFGSLQEPAW